MNLLDHTVLEVLEPPVMGEAEGVRWWTVLCRVNCYGQIETTRVHAFTEAEALAIKVGTVYQA